MRTASTTAGTTSQRPRRTATAPRTTPTSNWTGRSQDGVEAAVMPSARSDEEATLGMENPPACSVRGSATTKGSQAATTAADHTAAARRQRTRGKTSSSETKANAHGLALADAPHKTAPRGGRETA